jgi:hypothetical protein
MGDVPVPDVMESDQRLKHLILALIAGITAAVIAYFICDAIAKPTPGPNVGGQYGQGAYKFVWYMTALAGGGIFMITLGLLSAAAKNKWKREQEIAHARALKK